MGMDDRISNKAEDLKGRAKESVGAVTDNDDLKAEGQSDQRKASAKDKVEDVKDKAHDIQDKVKDKVDDVLH